MPTTFSAPPLLIIVPLAVPPEEITWDGRSSRGEPVTPGLTYSYVFEAFDRAGNKRNFVGEGFRLTAYRLATLAFVGGPSEAAHLRRVADCVRQAEGWDLPGILHPYPRRFAPDGTFTSPYAFDAASATALSVTGYICSRSAPTQKESLALAMIAMRFPNDVRRLIGALRKIAARSGVSRNVAPSASASGSPCSTSVARSPIPSSSPMRS